MTIDWNSFVFSDAFDQLCHNLPSSDSSSASSASYDDFNLLASDDASSIISTDSSAHAVPKLEAYLYYNGIRGKRKLGPKLIYRSSTDVFPLPSGPFQEVRPMQLLTVHEHVKLSKNNLWSKIRDQTAQLLDDKQIKFTSIDLARFRWEELTEDGRGEAVTSSVTIWIGVLPDSTNGDAAFNCAQEILNLLKEHNIDDIDVAFRESVAQPLTRPILYAPVNDFHPLKSVIDWLTTPLSLPIAGMKTQHMQGTLGFYFKIDDDLYGVTARHVLFPDTEGNELYHYDPALPKKNVILMGDRAFDDLLASIKASIGTLNNSLDVLEKNVRSYTAKAADGNQQAAEDLVKYQQKLDDTKATILSLKRFFVTLRTKWGEVNNRVIGHVVWSPPLTGLNPPHGYTQDVCVIKLDKRKFLPNFRGNVIDLGTEIEPGKFMSLLRPQLDMPSEFDYPIDRLYQLKDILSASKIKEPNSQDIMGDPTRFVIKRGPSTLTTFGRLNGFDSYERRYSLYGHHDSVQAAVYPYDNESGLFASFGDSGAAIVGTDNDVVAQLTGGAGSADSSEIIYGTPMEWLWNVIQTEFPNAVLFFDDPAHN